MAGPLTGIRVLDLTHVLNGPFSTMLLGHLGAEIIKVEFGIGDRFRRSWMPPDADHDGYEFVVVNCNKKGIALNLKSEKGRELLRRLATTSDVVVENFSIGVLERMGFGYEALKQLNPRIIYACARAYGESGPAAHVRGNATTNMAMTGWTYAAYEVSGTPVSGDMGIGDEAAGVSLALGITAALYEREKSGRGQKIEVSMQEALLGFMIQTLHGHFEGQKVGISPKKCADGHYSFFVTGIPDDQMAALAGAIGQPGLAADPRFGSLAARAANHRQLEDILTEFVRDKTRAKLWEIFSAAAISSAPVLSIGEVMETEHLKARKAFVEVDHPVSGRVKVLAPWIRFSETACEITSASPTIGQHNREVYGDVLGLSDAEITDLEQQGVIS